MKAAPRLALAAVYCLVGSSLVVALSGCGGRHRMALEKKHSGQLTLEKKSIALLTLKVTNQFKPRFHPYVESIQCRRQGGRATRFGPLRVRDMTPSEAMDYWANRSLESAPGKRPVMLHEYLVSLDLEPGTYTLGKVEGMSTFPLLVDAKFSFSVDTQFDIPPQSIVYLGHVEMINRKRKKGERRSGPITPLIDQAVAGYSNGTFEVSVTDRSDVDIPVFIRRYPVLTRDSIQTAIMKKE